jgi:hypothetical protein
MRHVSPFASKVAWTTTILCLQPIIVGAALSLGLLERLSGDYWRSFCSQRPMHNLLTQALECCSSDHDQRCSQAHHYACIGRSGPCILYHNSLMHINDRRECAISQDSSSFVISISTTMSELLRFDGLSMHSMPYAKSQRPSSSRSNGEE